MVLARMLPAALAAVSLVACGGGPGHDAETAAVDSAARAADSAARAASTGKLRVANVMVGKRLGSENRIAEPTFQFAPQDTVFISMGIQGAPGDGQLSARWLGAERQGAGLDRPVDFRRGGGQQGVPPGPGQGVAARYLPHHAVPQRRLGRVQDVRRA